MRIKKKNVGENIDKAKEYAKDSVARLKTDLEPVSQEIEQGIKDITGNEKTAKVISKKMAASAIDKAYSEESMNEVVDGKHTVEYHSERTDETPFIINGIKWQYVNAIYPDGKRDIGVYRFDHDLTYDFKWFMDEVIPKPGSYNVVDEVAVSDSQRKFMNAVLKCKVEGDCPSEDIKKAAESMSKKEIEDFAYTKGDLPSSVDEGISDLSDTRKAVEMFDYAWDSHLGNEIFDKLIEVGVPDELANDILINLSSGIWDAYHSYRRNHGGDIDESNNKNNPSVDVTHDMGIIQNIIRSVDNLSQVPVLKNLVNNFKVKHNNEPELSSLVDTLNNQINSIMRQSENEDRIASDAIRQGIKQGEVGDSEDDEYQTLLRSLAADSKEIESSDNKEPMNDLPFESVKPKMTKNELIESVLESSTKKRKVIKTISVKNLRNE